MNAPENRTVQPCTEKTADDHDYAQKIALKISGPNFGECRIVFCLDIDQ